APDDARPVDRADEAPPRFDEPARQQMRLSPAVPAVAVAYAVRLLAQIKRLLSGPVADEVECLGLVRLEVHRWRRPSIEPRQQIAPAAQSDPGQIGRRLEVAHLEVRGGRVGVEDERVVAAAEATAVLTRRDAAQAV